MADTDKKTTRGYIVTQERELNLADDKLLDQLRDEFGSGEELKVMINLGRVIHGTPTGAAESLGEARDLNGHIKVVTESAITDLGEGKTETKRVTTFS